MELAQGTMRTILVLGLVALCAEGSAAQSGRSLLRDGNRSYRQEKFADAEVNYRKALEKDKNLSQGEFNLGDALYKEGRYDEAAQQYGLAAIRQPDAQRKARAYHNLGNALLKSQRLPESIQSYEEALKLNPHDLDTKYNLAYARALLKQQQQQQNQKQDQKQNKDKQDQSKQDQKQQQQKQQEQEKKDQQQAQQKKQQISKQDAERILQALNNEERDVQKKLKKKVPARVKVEKDW